MRALLRTWNNTYEMPPLMRMLCQGAMLAGPILLLTLLVPVADWTVNRRKVSYHELWASGAAIAFLAFTLLVALGSWGIAAKRSVARWAVVAMPVAPFVVASLHPSTWFTHEVTNSFSNWIGSFGMAAMFYGCLFHIPSVRRYFGPTRHDPA